MVNQFNTASRVSRSRSSHLPTISRPIAPSTWASLVSLRGRPPATSPAPLSAAPRVSPPYRRRGPRTVPPTPATTLSPTPSRWSTTSSGRRASTTSHSALRLSGSRTTRPRRAVPPVSSSRTSPDLDGELHWHIAQQHEHRILLCELPARGRQYLLHLGPTLHRNCWPLPSVVALRAGRLEDPAQPHPEPRPSLGLPAALSRGPGPLVVLQSQRDQPTYELAGSASIRRQSRRRYQLPMPHPGRRPTGRTSALASGSSGPWISRPFCAPVMLLPTRARAALAAARVIPPVRVRRASAPASYCPPPSNGRERRSVLLPQQQ